MDITADTTPATTTEYPAPAPWDEVLAAEAELPDEAFSPPWIEGTEECWIGAYYSRCYGYGY